MLEDIDGDAVQLLTKFDCVFDRMSVSAVDVMSHDSHPPAELCSR